MDPDPDPGGPKICGSATLIFIRKDEWISSISTYSIKNKYNSTFKKRKKFSSRITIPVAIFKGKLQ